MSRKPTATQTTSQRMYDTTNHTNAKPSIQSNTTQLASSSNTQHSKQSSNTTPARPSSRAPQNVYAQPDSPIASMRRKSINTVNSPENTKTPVKTPIKSKLNLGQSTPHNSPAFQTSPRLFSPKFSDSNPRQHESKSLTVSTSSCRLVRRPMATSSTTKFAESIHIYLPPCLEFTLQLLQDIETNSGKEILLNINDEQLDPFHFIKSLPPLKSFINCHKIPIPVKSPSCPRITLALDLDETLVHCSTAPIDNAEFTFNVSFNGRDYEIYACVRPHLEYFLKTISQWFEIALFTASQKVYADTIVNILDPMNTYIKHRLFRDSCVYVNGNFLKDLNVLGRPLDQVVLLDNSLQAFGFQLDNGIPIESWYDDPNDVELLNLIPFLRHLKDVTDVRPYIRNTFRIQEFITTVDNLDIL